MNARPYLITLVVCLVTMVDTGCTTIQRFHPSKAPMLDARHLTHEAEAAVHDDRWEDAEQSLWQAVDRCPHDDHARSVLADVLWKREAYSEAIEQKAQSITLSGRRDPGALTELGQMELSVGRLQLALRHAEEALERDATFAHAWTLRGFVLRELDRPQEALSAFFRSLSIQDDDPLTRMEIAKLYRSTNQPRRALAILGVSTPESQQSCPHFPEACYLRGLVLSELQRPVDAIAAFESARNSGYQAEDLLVRLAESQLAAGLQLKARETIIAARESAVPSQEAALADLQARLTGDVRR